MKIPSSDGFTGEFYLISEEEILQCLHRFFQKIQEGALPESCYEVSILLTSKPDEDIIRKGNYRTVFPMNIDAKSLTK